MRRRLEPIVDHRTIVARMAAKDARENDRHVSVRAREEWPSAWVGRVVGSNGWALKETPDVYPTADAARAAAVRWAETHNYDVRLVVTP